MCDFVCVNAACVYLETRLSLIIYYAVVEGGVKEVTELLKYPWGKVVFTGSERVGKVCCHVILFSVARIASLTTTYLTPFL